MAPPVMQRPHTSHLLTTSHGFRYPEQCICHVPWCPNPPIPLYIIILVLHNPRPMVQLLSCPVPRDSVPNTLLPSVGTRCRSVLQSPGLYALHSCYPKGWMPPNPATHRDYMPLHIPHSSPKGLCASPMPPLSQGAIPYPSKIVWRHPPPIHSHRASFTPPSSVVGNPAPTHSVFKAIRAPHNQASRPFVTIVALWAPSFLPPREGFIVNGTNVLAPEYLPVGALSALMGVCCWHWCAPRPLHWQRSNSRSDLS